MDLSLDASPAISTTIHDPFRPTTSPVASNAPPPKRQKVMNDGEELVALPFAKKGKTRKKAPVSSEATSHLTLTIPQDQPETGAELSFQSAIGEKSAEKPHLSPSKDSQADGSIRCICGTHWDDGQMVQCDECQTWQHTRCYRVDFNKLTEDALWVCVVCDEAKWRGMTLDSEWANRTQRNLQEKERFAQYAKELEERASRGGSTRRGRGGRRGAPVILDTSSALISTRRGFEGSNGDIQDEVDTWQKVYVPLKRNVVESPLVPKIHHYMKAWGPTSRYATITCKSTKGWTTSRPTTHAYDVGVYDISSRSLPIVVSSEEITAAKEEVWVTVRSRHCPQPDDIAISRPKTPGTQRTSVPPPPLSLPLVPPQQVEEALTPAPTPRNLDNSYRSIFLQATTNPQIPHPGHSQQSSSLIIDTIGQVQASRSTASPAPESRKGASSPITNRVRKTTPQFPDSTATSKSKTEGIPTVSPYTPQQYTLHARREIPARTLIALYPSHIITHETYVGIPSNQYLRVGTPKNHVRMFPPPLDVVLDARIVGGIGRFARSGCWPNSALRGVVIPREKDKQSRKRGTSDDEQSEGNVDEQVAELMFGIFSLRCLEEGEEVVLAWEWDDSHRVHRLPRLFLEEARSLIRFSSSVKSDEESQFFIKLSQSLSDAFGGCACVDSNIPPEKQLDGISGRCAIEELSRWAERQKHAGSIPPTRSGSADVVDVDQAELDEAIDTLTVESTSRVSLSQSQKPITHTPQRANLPPIDPVAPWLSPHSDNLSRTSRNPASLGFITQPLAPTSTSTHGSLVAQHHLSQSSSPQPPVHMSIVSPTPRPTDAILSHDSARLSSTTPLHRNPGSASIASILNQVDTHPLPRPTSRSAPGVITVPASQSLQINHAKLNPLQRIWGQSPTAPELLAREGELDEDVLKRSLKISLGPLIGLSRGVRYEDARGMGGPALRPAPRVSTIKRWPGEKRKRDETEDNQVGEGETFIIKRQKLAPPIAPPFARRRKQSKRQPTMAPANPMDVDETAAASFPFTFSVPISDPIIASISEKRDSLPSDGTRILDSDDTIMTERLELILPVPLSSHDGHDPHSRDDRPASSSSTTSKGIQMAIASILNSPSSPNVDRTPFQKGKQSMESPSSSKTLDPLPNDEVDLTDGIAPLSTIPEEPNTNGFTNVATLSHDTASDIEIPTPPALQSQSDVLDDLSKTHSIHNDHPQEVAIRTSSSPINGKQSTVEEQTLSRPITPIPMVLQVNLMSRRWHSPVPSSVQDDRSTIERMPLISPPPRSSITPKRESIGAAESLSSDNTIPPRPETPPPVLVKGRLVTPPSRDATPVEMGHKETESDSNNGEDEDTSSLSEEDEDASMQSKSSSNDSDSLTPAPSPTPLPVDLESTPDPREHTVSPALSHVHGQTPIPQIAQEAISPLSVDAVDVPMASEHSIPLVRHDNVISQTHVETVEDQSYPTGESTLREKLSPSDSERNHSSVSGHEVSTVIQQPIHAAESSGTSTAHIRRRTLQGYASRRKKDPLISPSVNIPHSSLVDTPSSPLYPPKFAEGHPLAEAPSAQEHSTYESPILGQPVADKLLPHTPVHGASLMVTMTPVIKEEIDHLPEPQTDLSRSDKGALDEKPLFSTSFINYQHNSGDTRNEVDRIITPERASSLSITTRPRTPTSPRRRPDSPKTPRWQPPTDKSTPPMRSPDAQRTMEDGEIDVSSGSSPPRPLGSQRHDQRLDLRGPQSSTFRSQGSPLSLPRSSYSDLNTVFPDPSATSSSTNTSRPLTNGNGRPPTGPRNNHPPPSGPRALRGLDLRSQGRSNDKASRLWERDRERDREQERDRDRDRNRERDWDRDRDRESDHRYWRDSRPRGTYRPRGK